MIIDINTYGTLVAASLVLLLGRKVVRWLPVLRAYTIPETIVGGLCAAIAILLLKSISNIEINFDTSIRDPLLLAFFATIGLNANIPKLRAGGRVLGTFVMVVVGLLISQNLLGIGVAMGLGLDPLMGLLAGSITMYGGHATGVAWGQIFVERYGFENATEVAMACATFGLVMGGLLGGPISRYLLKRTPLAGGHNLDDNFDIDAVGDATISADSNENDDQSGSFEKPGSNRSINSFALIETIAMIAICLSVGSYIAALLVNTAFELPPFVCVLFVGVVLSNILAMVGFYTVFERAVSVLGNVSLSLFLALALMSLKLWELSSLALPMLSILLVQAMMMGLYAIFVTYRLMGKNYDAIVITAGHCGFGLGATPTAIANMQAVTDRFGPSHVAFLVVPMTGAFFLDIINSIAIKLFLLLPMFPDIGQLESLW